MKIISRKEAKGLGLKKYYTGKLCKRDHLSERRTCNGHCIECRTEYRLSDRHKDYAKAYQKKTRGKNPNAYRSRAHYQYHKDKANTKTNCEKCESIEKVEAHHHDYDKPLDVTFLCKRCHTEWHKNNTPLNRISGIFTTKEK